MLFVGHVSPTYYTKYFSVGKIAEDQVEDMAEWSGISKGEVER